MSENTTEETPEDESSRREFLKSSAMTGLFAGGVGTELWWITQSMQDEDVDKTFLLGGKVAGWQGFAPKAISGTSNPTLKLEAGNTYRVLWQNLDGVPHNFQIRNSEGQPIEALIPLEIQADKVQDLFTRAQQKALANVSVANATDVPANVTLANETGNLTANVTMDVDNETVTRKLDVVASTKLLSEEGAVQGVQFTATENMARYICVVHPTSMVGDIQVAPAKDGGQQKKTVVMKNISFNPVRARVAPGTTVEWVNKDGFAHTVTAAQFHDKAADWQFDKRVGAGNSVTHTFENAGVYEYYCTIHGKGSMCGAVLVGDVSLDAQLPCEGGDGGVYDRSEE